MGELVVKARHVLLGLLAMGVITAQSRAGPPPKLALCGGRIIPVVGEPIEEGTLLIEHGRISALGADVKVPYDAMVVDVKGQVLFPGMIAPHSWQGLDRPNENLPVTPYLDVYDALDPSGLFFEDALRRGVLAVHVIQGNNCAIGGLSRLVHPIGRTPDEMTIRPAIALKMSTSPKSGYDRMTQLATFRETFLELEQYLENLAENRYEAKRKEEGKKVEVPPEEARKRGRELIRDEDCDDKHRNLYRLIQGRLDAWIYCGQATDVGPAIRMAREHGFLERTVFVLGTEAYRAVDELKEAGRPVVLSAELVHQERDPITGQLHETFVPKVIHEAGLLFALQADPSGSLAERYLPYQAARCVRAGIPRQAAIAAITINPARILGVDDRLGSLEVGKAAYVVVFSGDPLDFNSWVEKAYIDGVLAYDRSKDVRLQELLGLKMEEAEEQPEAPEKEKPEKKREEPQKKKPAPTAREEQKKDNGQAQPNAAKQNGRKPGADNRAEADGAPPREEG